MPKFGSTSKKRLNTCHIDLKILFNHVIKQIDCSVLCGYRNKKDQDKAVAEGHSKAKYPNGRHNAMPSNAVDVVPYPVDWNDRERFFYFAGLVLAMADMLYDIGQMKHRVRWGGNWKGFENGKIDFSKNTFDDLPHFELIKE